VKRRFRSPSRSPVSIDRIFGEPWPRWVPGSDGKAASGIDAEPFGVEALAGRPDAAI